LRALLAVALASTAVAAAARAQPASPLNAYAQARIAASTGALDRASAGFVAAMAASPDNELIAAQALAHGVNAGDWPLALAAARTLERRSLLLPDARFLLVADAFHRRDWRAATVQIDAVERERVFAIVVPVLRAWLAQGARQGDPLALLAPNAQGETTVYAVEQRPFLLAALGRPEAAAELGRMAAAAGPRAIRMRIAGASVLARRDRAAALTLLAGDSPPLAVARGLLESNRPIPGPIAAPDAAMAELLVRLSLDLHAQNLTPVAATFARLATWLAPDNSETWMVAAELLAQQNRQALAVPLLANVPAGDPFASAVRDQRIRLLSDSGDRETALAEALTATRAPAADAADWVRLGEVYNAMNRHAEAAEAFGSALAARTAGQAGQAEWTLWLMRGGALDEAGNWPGARAALQQAYRLAPDQPFVLNYLGYAQLARRENVVEAERLVREAHRLAPDNAAITDSLGWALYLKGELPEAISLLERAAEGEPADVEINEHLGDAYFTAGRRLQARYAWRAALVYAEGEDSARITRKIDTGLTPLLAAR
jgi:tetratricopeptide (TPR) repeat protein